MATIPGTESVRFRRPTTGPNAPKPKEIKKDQFGSLAPEGWKRRHTGILQDLVGRQRKGPFVPSFSVAVRILLLLRAGCAMYNIISDCDEVFNFFEPLHYFQHNEGFQTWELSPQFAIRSWSYVLLHWPLAGAIPRLLSLGKRQQFFAVRMFLGFISTICEAKFYRAVVDSVNERVGRYLFFMMIFSAGMSSASVSFLPSTFTMYTTLLASSYWFHPATSTPTGTSRAYKATLLFAVGAIVGWPFSAALAIPFVLEQLFTTGGEIAVGQDKQNIMAKRWDTMLRAIALGASISIPVYLIDSWVYGRHTFPTFNILWYNILSPLGGPDLYGTSPPTYYLANLFLNFNFLLPMALLSLPALAITYQFDYKRLGKTQMKPIAGQTSPYTLLITRLAPFYIWLTILSAQAHKEERFFFPAYPLLCFNAAVSVFLAKGWFETAYIKITKSPWNASQTKMFSNFTLAAIMIPSAISIFRIIAIYKFYHGPLDIAYHFQYTTIPHILTSLGHGPKPPPKNYKPYKRDEVIVPEWDYTPLTTLDPAITLCYASEWHRYPGSYLIPEGIDVQWVKTDFDGMMPRRWESSAVTNSTGAWPRPETRVVRDGRFNGMNKASVEPGAFIPVEQCNYLISLNLPSQPHTDIERDYIHDPAFEKEFCTTFLDGASSKWWARLVWIPWLPQALVDQGRVYGEYCLLKRKLNEKGLYERLKHMH